MSAGRFSIGNKPEQDPVLSDTLPLFRGSNKELKMDGLGLSPCEHENAALAEQLQVSRMLILFYA